MLPGGRFRLGSVAGAHPLDRVGDLDGDRLLALAFEEPERGPSPWEKVGEARPF